MLGHDANHAFGWPHVRFHFAKNPASKGSPLVARRSRPQATTPENASSKWLQFQLVAQIHTPQPFTSQRPRSRSLARRDVRAVAAPRSAVENQSGSSRKSTVARRHWSRARRGAPQALDFRLSALVRGRHTVGGAATVAGDLPRDRCRPRRAHHSRQALDQEPPSTSASQ